MNIYDSCLWVFFPTLPIPKPALQEHGTEIFYLSSALDLFISTIKIICTVVQEYKNNKHIIHIYLYPAYFTGLVIIYCVVIPESSFTTF